MGTTSRVSALVFGSGFCALVYQVVWMRHFRLIFGASTAASAAVLAVFMGGLGVGAYVLSSRAERHANALRLYAHLELGISMCAAVSPMLVLGARAAYLGLGGIDTLGSFGAATVRLLLAVVVIGAPTFLMGGTLPAVVRAAEHGADRARRIVGLLYAFNTLGAVTGAALATFVLLEFFGVSQSLWVAALLNVLIAIVARSLSRGPQFETGATAEAAAAPEAAKPADAESGAPVPVVLVLVAAGVVGFAFFAMELVWYRMLAPLLGGSSYSFGLILALALFGVGLGGLIYGRGERARRPTLALFATTCALEGLLMVLPYAVGDGVAATAMALRSLGGLGFGGLVMSWTLVAGLVVIPPAIVAGYQFPVLVGVLGAGREGVGRQVGLAYMSNTIGAIVGSIAAGFGLISLLGAPGLWLTIIVLLALLAIATAIVAMPADQRRSRLALPVGIAALALLMIGAEGPTAVWRHSPIGVGRVSLPTAGPNAVRTEFNERRRSIAWEADGIESAVAVTVGNGYSFVVNGKNDGNALADAPTVIMAPLIGALLHPDPRQGLVVGLGTGTSAGWLAAVDGMEHVDVVEFEPVVEHVARMCGAVNRNVLDDPNVTVVYGDGREFLATTKRRYDVIMSEPSNPYRAGIASLYSQDFYEYVAGTLDDDGVFVQWLQNYEVDAVTVRAVIATLSSVFPQVEVWSVQGGDLAVAAWMRPTQHHVERTRARTRQEPYRSALAHMWGVEGVEGFYAGLIAGPGLADAIREADVDWIDTDDQPVLEFGFSRGVGQSSQVSQRDIHEVAKQLGADRPPLLGELDWNAVIEARSARETFLSPSTLDETKGLQGEARARVDARRAYQRRNAKETIARWFAQSSEPRHHADVLALAHALAREGDERAPQYIELLRAIDAVEAALVSASWYATRRDLQAVADQLVLAIETARTHPWARGSLMSEAFAMAVNLARETPEQGRRIYDALAEPLAAGMADRERLFTRLSLAEAVDFAGLCVEAMEPFEPNMPWQPSFLAGRRRCYEAAGSDLLDQARDDLQDSVANAPRDFGGGLVDIDDVEGSWKPADLEKLEVPEVDQPSPAEVDGRNPPAESPSP